LFFFKIIIFGFTRLFINVLQEDSDGGLIAIAIGCGFIFLIFFFMRMFGAWMFRINDVVDELKQVNRKLTKIEKQLNKDSE